MELLLGTWAPEWGHTCLAMGFGKVYSLRSLAGGSALLVREEGSELPIVEYPTPGEHSCHITLLAREAVVSDYTSGTLSLFPLDAAGVPCGKPRLIRFSGHGPNPERQASPHIHSSWLSPDGGSLVVADLGSDRIYRFAVRDGSVIESAMESFAMPSGCGPRHCAFGKDVLYVSTELSDEVLTLSWPGMILLGRSTVNDAHPSGGGHLELSPDGKFLYVSSRLENDGIAVFRVGESGLPERISYVPTGRHPRHFCLSPDGGLLFCACRDENAVQIFERDAETGSLSMVPQQIEIEKPVFVLAYEKD